MILARRFACLVVVWGMCLGFAASSHAADMVQPKTLFNLAGSVRGYLSLDANSGAPAVAATSSVAESGTWWELVSVGRQRGYRTHMIVSRGNSRFNGMFLAVDEKTGQLGMSDDRDTENTKWLIRYAGYFQGYDAYYVQLLGKTEGGFDLSYLAVDAAGAVVMQRDVSDAINWRVRRGPALPAEVIR
jgi:hypothetical protein